MKNVVWVFFLVLGVFSCKEKQLTPEEIQPLVGKWRVTAIERADKKEWEYVTQSGQHQFEIRYDGVVLDSKGLSTCCGPLYLTINGKKFSIVPKETVPDNPICALINCVYCETWNMDLQDNVLTISYCNGLARVRYVKI